MTQLTQVLEELQSGPATAQDIADATGMHRKHTGHYLAELVRMGLATRKALPPDGARPQFLYTAVKS